MGCSPGEGPIRLDSETLGLQGIDVNPTVLAATAVLALAVSVTGLSAALPAASLIGGGKLPFLALGLSSLTVLAPAPDRLGAASHSRRA